MIKQLRIRILGSFLISVGVSQVAFADPLEIYCTIRENSPNLTCQWTGKGERKTLGPEDISTFVDAGESLAYMTLKSRKGMERTYMISGSSPQYKRLADVKKKASISEVNKAKGDLFNEIEKKIIEISDNLDAKAAAMDLIKYDPSVANDKFKRESFTLNGELDSYKKNREKICTSTPAFEQMSKANASLQQSLSNILYAFQAPDSCMSDFKIFKDKDGTVDLRQLDGVSKKFTEQCKKK